jgi:hypothetical protein
MVVAVGQRDLKQPIAIGLAFHGKGLRIPVVEIPDEIHALGGGCDTNEIDGLGHLFRGVTVIGGGTKGWRVGTIHRFTTLTDSLATAFFSETALNCDG